VLDDLIGTVVLDDLIGTVVLDELIGTVVSYDEDEDDGIGVGGFTTFLTHSPFILRDPLGHLFCFGAATEEPFFLHLCVS